MTAEKKSFLGLSKNVRSLGWVSLFNDIASEMIYPLLPLFLNTVLGAGVVFIGLIEGIAESVSSFLKLFSGWVSDRFQKRKGLILFGYFLASITRPFIGLATSAYHVLFLRFFDRIGKGVRSSPRDALLSQSCGEEERGKAFGFQRAMDHAGAMTGPLIASLLMAVFTEDLRTIFLLAFIPSLFCLWILWRGVTDIHPVRNSSRYDSKPSETTNPAPSSPKLNWKGWDRRFKYFLLIITLFTLGNSSDAFLLLRAQDLGLNIVTIPILWFIFHLSKTAFSIPGGTLSDRIGRRKVMILAWTVYGLVYLGFAFVSKPYHIWLLFIVYGLFYGLSEGTEKAWVADLVEESKRGTAYGAYHFCIGIAALPASLLMGLIWKAIGVQWAFSFGAVMALIAALLAIALMGSDQKEKKA
ncbi:MAG: MFS transporter [Deltaproteobacteria bacterium]|nr:MFS transporter [Deltaproteobacteria bacterium]